MIRSKHDNGSALAELAGLLPVYMLVILGMLYISDLAGIRMNLQPTAEQAAAQPSTTTQDSLQTQEFAEYNHSGDLTLDRPEPKASPLDGRVHEILDRICVNPGSKPYANVSWKFVNGQLVPILDTGSTKKPAELTPNYLDEDKPDLLEMTLHGLDSSADYIVGECTADATYRYAPGYVFAYEKLDEQKIRSQHTALVRGAATRNVEETSQGHPIEQLVERMPSTLEPRKLSGEFLPYNRDLWLPDKKRSTP